MKDRPNVVDLSSAAKRRKAKKQTTQQRAKGKTLCSRGFHKWEDDPKKQFDVKAGKLVSISRCRRCGVSKTLTS